MMPLVSVIVPIYNVEDYLDQCLASLESQTLENIEILLVNDGSTDGSAAVIDRYVQRNPGKFYRLDKENSGPGGARNHGLQHAKADYISFIDGDDFAEPTMMEQLYSTAKQHSCDIVQADLHGFNNNVDYQAIERCPFAQAGLIPKRELMLNSTKPVVVSPCTKLYRKSLFSQFNFPDTWYEDLCLFPILFSHASSYYYLPQPLYHYRWERAGSIQTQSDSPRTLEIFTSKERILELCHPDWLPEAVYAVYEHTCRFFKGKPHFAKQALDFAQKHTTLFAQNPFIREEISAGKLPNFLPQENTLPKIIHTCHFEGMTLSPQTRACIASWEQCLPGWQLRIWTEKDIDLCESTYVQRAYMQKDWAAVAGYVACKALQAEGGLYLDAGLLLKRPMESLLGYDAILTLGGKEQITWEVFAAQKGHPLLADICALYSQAVYAPDDANGNAKMLRRAIWELLAKRHHLSSGATAYVLPERVALYAADKLLIDTGDGDNAAELICNGFSPQNGAPNPTKHQLQKQYYLDKYSPKTPPPPLASEGVSGTSWEAADSVVQQYGVANMVKAICRRVVRVIFRR